MFFKKAFSRSPNQSSSVKIGLAIPVSTLGRKSDAKMIPSTPTIDYSRFGMCSIHGRKREDRIIFGERVYRDVFMFGVIDGHGGDATAEYLKVALPRIVSTLCRERYQYLTTMDEDPDSFQDILKTAFKLCSDEWDRNNQTSSGRVAGAVATIVLVQDRTCIIAHVGDGRVVAATSSASALLTEEHRASIPSEKERIESKGGRVVSGRVKGLLSPSRAFGDIQVRTTENGSVLDCISPEPDLSVFSVDLEGFLIVSTDGVNDVMNPTESANFVRDSLRRTGDASIAATELASWASKISSDDVSVIVLSWR